MPWQSTLSSILTVLRCNRNLHAAKEENHSSKADLLVAPLKRIDHISLRKSLSKLPILTTRPSRTKQKIRRVKDDTITTLPTTNTRS